MDVLFAVGTDSFLLRWSGPEGQSSSHEGLLRFGARVQGVVFTEETWRGLVPDSVARDPSLLRGPGLREETTYHVYLRSKSQSVVSLWHRDPVILNGLRSEEHGALVHGTVNFGRQIGHCVLTILVDRRPVCDVEVEVFPSKMDYQTDYAQIMADVQEVMTGLALEYLRSTHLPGMRLPSPKGTELEWLVLLRSIVEELERGALHVSRRPQRSLVRRQQTRRVELIRRVDSVVRASIRKRGVAGAPVCLEGGIECRRHVNASIGRTTLDTAEHRWISAQLRAIVRKLQHLKNLEQKRSDTARRPSVVNEISTLEHRISRLCELEPFREANGDVPPGFASLSLLGTPGYRELYQCCIVLSCSLRVEGGPLGLSVSDLDQLYEQWCYIALLRLVSEATGQSIPAAQLVGTRAEGLCVRLERGKSTRIPFPVGETGFVDVTYSPTFGGENMLVPQRPDILLSVRHGDWPAMDLVLDAKYRLDTSDRYIDMYGVAGPPEDALNVLYRYRDAILHADGDAEGHARPTHSVVYAAALFPEKDEPPGGFLASRCWKSLGSLGVGAVPLLPDNLQYLREWLRSILHGGGWALADRVLTHSAIERARMWSRAALEPVLVAPLRAGSEVAHLQWIEARRQYYLPYARTQQRQFEARAVALYSPGSLRGPGAVTRVARVLSVEVRRRGDIQTPWKERRESGELQVLYHLDSVETLKNPIHNDAVEGRRHSFSNHRWTSRLALERATEISQLLLETEQEWRLYEEFEAASVDFCLRARRLQRLLDGRAVPHACFVVSSGMRVQYIGESGFLLEGLGGWTERVARVDEVVRLVQMATLTTRIPR